MFRLLLTASFVAGLGITALAATPAKSPKPKATVLVGKVVDAKGAVVAGADVQLDSEPRADRPQTVLAKAKTAKDGTFRLDKVPPGKNYVLSARIAVGKDTAWGSMGGVDVQAGKENDAGTLKLNPPGPTM